MPPTTNIVDCQRFADSIAKAGGTVPAALTNILSGADLMARHSASSDPAKAIVDAAVAGTLDEKRLTGLIEKAAHAQMVADFTGDTRQRIEPLMVAAFHITLKDGGGDEILNSLRPAFDRHAEAVADARTLIPPGSIDSFLASATSKAVTAWQGLNAHVQTLESIGRIAAQFGCRTAQFPQITEYTLGDNFRLDDRALMCCDGPSLPADSQPFQSPDQGRLSSPWCRTTLRLHTIATAQTRYDRWASGEWDKHHAGPMESWIDEDGNAHERERPKNPYRGAKEPVS